MQETEMKAKPSVINCPRCELVNAIENKYCSKCSYPIKPEAYDEIKQEENKRIQELEIRHKKEIENIRQEIEKKFAIILEKIEIKNLG